ncbi:MAG: RNA polymerase sigma factor [Planctomycetota bacterium]
MNAIVLNNEILRWARAPVSGMSIPARASVEDPDREALHRVLAGDDEAFGQIVARHEASLRRLILGLVGERELAEDVLQETFWVAYRALPRFRGEARLGTWLYRIAVREASRWRVRWRRSQNRTVSLADWDGPCEAGPDRLEQSEELGRAFELLEKLRAPERAALVLHVAEGHTYEEIAEVLEAKPGTVASWIHRARARLTELVSQDRGSVADRRVRSDLTTD